MRNLTSLINLESRVSDICFASHEYFFILERWAYSPVLWQTTLQLVSVGNFKLHSTIENIFVYLFWWKTKGEKEKIQWRLCWALPFNKYLLDNIFLIKIWITTIFHKWKIVSRKISCIFKIWRGLKINMKINYLKS